MHPQTQEFLLPRRRTAIPGVVGCRDGVVREF